MTRAVVLRWVGRRAYAFGVLGAGLVWLATILALAGAHWWGFELFAPFRLQYAVGGLLAAGLTVARPGIATAAAALAGAVNLAFVAPWLGMAPSPAEDPLVVMSFNVHTRNVERAAACAEIRRHRPHVVFVIETDKAWLAALEGLEGYKVVTARPAPDNFGIVALSRIPGTTGQVHTFSEAGLPGIELRVPWRGEALALLGTHTFPPVDAFATSIRDTHLMEVAEWANSSTQAYAVFGDLNVTPHSSIFEDLEAQGELQRVGGLEPTWPAEPTWLAWGLGIPIDHALLGPGLAAADFVVGAHAGSDHRPIIVSLVPSDPP